MVVEYECETRAGGVLLAVLRLSRMLGLAPHRTTRTARGALLSTNTAQPWLTRCILVVLCVFALSCVLVNHQKKAANQGLSVEHLVWIVKFLETPVTVIVTVWGAPGRMKSLVSNLNAVKQIHSDLHIQYKPEQLSKTQSRFLWGWILFNLLRIVIDHIHVSLISDMLINELILPISYFIIFMTNLISTLAAVIFMLLVCNVRSAFKAVNSSLKKLLLAAEIDNKTSQELIPRICASYGRACDAVRDVDTTHGLMLIAILTSSFINLVVTPYYFITEEAPPSRCYEYYMIEVLHCARIITYFANIVIIVEPCQGTYTEMEYTRELVSRLMQRAVSVHDPLAVELEQFCKHLTLNQLAYSPLTIFKLQRSLIVTIIASITTYLMIVVDIK